MTTTVLPTPAPPNMAALPPWASGARQVDDLDAGFEDGGRRTAIGERRRRPMDGRARHVRRQRRAVIADAAGDIQETTEHGIADRHGDRMSRRAHRHSAFQPGGLLKRDAANRRLVEMRLNLHDQGPGPVPFDDQGLIELRKGGVLKGDVDNRASHGKDFSLQLRQLRHRNYSSGPQIAFYKLAIVVQSTAIFQVPH